MSVCSLRVACNTRRKNQSTGEWEDKPNFFDVTVWGAQGENCARFLSKGRPVALDGRLEWREWEDQQGNKRQAIDIIADAVQFLGGREEGSGGGGGGFTPRSDVPVDDRDFQPAGAARRPTAAAAAPPPTTTSRSRRSHGNRPGFRGDHGGPDAVSVATAPRRRRRTAARGTCRALRPVSGSSSPRSATAISRSTTRWTRPRSTRSSASRG